MLAFVLCMETGVRSLRPRWGWEVAVRREMWYHGETFI